MIINISTLNPAIRRKIKSKEKSLGKKCYKVWSFKNPLGEEFLFGRFGKIKEDWTPVTLATKCDTCIGGWNSLSY